MFVMFVSKIVLFLGCAMKHVDVMSFVLCALYPHLSSARWDARRAISDIKTQVSGSPLRISSY